MKYQYNKFLVSQLAALKAAGVVVTKMKVSSTSNIFRIAVVAALMILDPVRCVSGAFITQLSRCTSVYTSKPTNTQLAFGIPSFLTPPTPNDNNNENKKKKSAGVKTESKKEEGKAVGLKGLVQLVMAGAGAPFLGDFEGVDKETGKFMFSLEANNLVDENGQSKQTQMPYFENGWVDPADLEREEQRKKNGGGFKFPW